MGDASDMFLTRKQFLSLTGLAAAGWLKDAAAGAPADSRLLDRIEQWLREYDAQGIHRTGGGADRKSARWLAGKAKECGGAVSLEPIALDRVDPQRCFIEAGGKRIEGLPIFDAPFTDAKGVRGRLSVVGAYPEMGRDAGIGVIELPPNAEYVSNYESLRRDSRHRAMVFITKGARPGLSPINASKFGEAYGRPVLQIGSEDGEWLRWQAANKAEVVLVAQVKRTKVQALNVTATIKGANDALAPLVVMTPRSGWWHSTSERGGGLVCWLEAMRGLAANKPARDVHFISSTGHELGHLGLRAFIDRRPELVRSAYAWLHFGANIGAKDAPNRIQAFDDELESLAVAALGKRGMEVNDKAKRGAIPFGEAGNIHRGGGRYISLLCLGNPLFHHPDDRWPGAPNNLDVPAIARYASAFSDLAVTLAR